MALLLPFLCMLMCLSGAAAKAMAQDADAIAALPADHLYVEGITASIPGYGSMASIDKVRELRRYVYQHTPVGNPLIDDHVLNLPLKDAYAVYATAGGSYCWGTAVMLSRVYKAAGFNSWLYDFGGSETGDPTHATTLVEVNGEVILQDAFFNYEYLDIEGRPIPFLDLIALIAKGEAPSAKAGVANRPWLFTDRAEAEQWIGPYKQGMTCERTEAALRCNAQYSLSRYLDMDPSIQEFVARKGWPPQMEYLMLYPISLDTLYSDTDRAEALLAKIKQRISATAQSKSPNTAGPSH